MPGDPVEPITPEEALRLLLEVDRSSALFQRCREILADTLEIEPAISRSAPLEWRLPPTVEGQPAEPGNPFHFFDAIYCINLDRRKDRWEAMERRFRKLEIEHRVRRFAAAETPLNHHIGCALSHRRIIAEAKRLEMRTVLVFEDDARFSPNAAQELAFSLRELHKLDWQLLYLGGFRREAPRSIPGCRYLMTPTVITCTHAIAYHHSVYDAILGAVPDNAPDVALWLLSNYAIDQFYTFFLPAARFLTWPVIATQDTILDEEEGRLFDE